MRPIRRSPECLLSNRHKTSRGPIAAMQRVKSNLGRKRWRIFLFPRRNPHQRHPFHLRRQLRPETGNAVNHLAAPPYGLADPFGEQQDGQNRGHNPTKCGEQPKNTIHPPRLGRPLDLRLLF